MVFIRDPFDLSYSPTYWMLRLVVWIKNKINKTKGGKRK